MEAKKEYLDLVNYAVDQAKKSDADAAEAYISDSESVQITVSNKEAEQVNAVKDKGIGLRILKDEKMVFGSSNILARDTITDLVSDLMRKVTFHTRDEFNVIPAKDIDFMAKEWSSYSDLISYDPKIAQVAIEQKIKNAIRLESAGLEYSPKVTGAMMIFYQDGTDYVYLANSNGISGWYPTSGCGGGVYFSAAEGKDQQSGNYTKVVVNYDDFNPEEVGKKGAENAVRMLGAKPIESCEIPLVISPDVGTQILRYIVGMLSADRVQKGKSLFADKLDTQVASSMLNIIDDGKLKGGLSTSPVDGEGVPQQTTTLIMDGFLKNYLYDSYTAKKGKVKSTGNRSRSGYQSSGGIGSTNLYLEQGDVSPEEMMAKMDKGFYLKDAIGLHGGIDSTSGDFSFPCAGFLIENGQLARPIRGISIGGNLFEFLKAVDQIGNDLTWFYSTGCPTFSVASIKVSGVG